MSRAAARERPAAVGPRILSPVEAAHNRWKTYAWTAGALGVTAGVAATVATCAPALVASPGVLLATALVGPVLLCCPIHRLRHRPVLQTSAFVAFSAVAGAALSVMGTVGASLLISAALATACVAAGVAWKARGATEIKPDHGVPLAGIGVFWGLTANATAGMGVTTGFAAGAIRLVAGVLGILATGNMIVGHCSQVQVEAWEEDYDPMCHALRLYIDLIFLFGGIGRGLRPPT